MNTPRNPIYARLSKPRRTLRGFIKLTTTLSAVSTVFWVAVTVFRKTRPGMFDTLIAACCTAGACLTILTPWTVISVAVTLIVRDIKDPSFELIHVTPIPNVDIVQGYLFAALHRVRVYLILLVNWLPFLLIAFIGSYVPRVAGPDPRDQWAVFGLMLAAIVIGVCGISFLAACLGLCLGVWLRERTLATLISIGTSMVLLVVFVGTFSRMANSATRLSEIINIPNILSALLILLLPYIAGIRLINIAASGIRRRSIF